MARIHGSKGQFKMDPAGGTSPVPVADLNAWTLDRTRDTVDVTAFQDNVKQYVLGLPDCKGTFGGWYSSVSSPALFTAALSNTPVTLELVPDSTAPTYHWTGPAYLDCSMEVTSSGAVTVTGNFVGAGVWTWEPAA
ncbi:MAG TPA: hypothetical protein VIX63_05495 [Vicinamibacterales bacterium]